MAEYESLIHLPKWRRVLIWLLESSPGRTISVAVILAIFLGPIYYFGLWWFVVIVAASLGYWLGYSVARSHWLQGDDIPRL